jgi:hypothetical protein
MSVLTCQPGDRNQQFNYTYPTIQWVGSNPLECLDLTNGSIANGNIVCYFVALHMILLLTSLPGPNVWMQRRD